MCNIKERKNPTDFSTNLVLTSLVLLPNHKCVQYCFQATNDFSTVSKPPMSLVLPLKPPISSILPPNHRCLQYSFKNTYLFSIAFKPPMSSVFPPGHNGFQNSIEATDFLCMIAKQPMSSLPHHRCLQHLNHLSHQENKFCLWL